MGTNQLERKFELICNMISLRMINTQFIDYSRWLYSSSDLWNMRYFEEVAAVLNMFICFVRSLPYLNMAFISAYNFPPSNSDRTTEYFIGNEINLVECIRPVLCSSRLGSTKMINEADWLRDFVLYTALWNHYFLCLNKGFYRICLLLLIV